MQESFEPLFFVILYGTYFGFNIIYYFATPIFSMTTIFSEGNEEYPSINLDKQENVFFIKGRSIPHNSEKIYGPVINWFEEYLTQPNESTTLEFELDYFNTSTQKYLADLFKLINNKRDKSKHFVVIWKYGADDDDMKMIGEQFQYFVDFKFDFQTI